MKQTVTYFNDSDQAVLVSVGTLYQENTVVLQPLQVGLFEVELEEGDGIFVKRWNRAVLISKVDKNAIGNLKGIRPTSQREVPTSTKNK